MKTRPALHRVDPATAADWLTRSRQAVVSNKVDRYAARMRAGEWDPDLHFNQPVSISPGKLSNGNHRLHAVVQSGCTALMWVKGKPDADDPSS